MKVLAISTSTPRGSAAVLDGDQLVARVAYRGEMEHAERLLAVLDEVLTQAHLHRHQLDALACDVGPGSFTGVRAGLAAAKGIALGLELPLVPVGSLEAMALAALAEPAARCAEAVVCLLDAKRRETFLAVFDRGLVALRGPEALPTVELPAALRTLVEQPRTFFVGAQTERLDPWPERWLRSSSADLPDAAWVARCASPLLEQGTFPPLAQVQPVYVRAPDATPQRLAPRPDAEPDDGAR